MSHNEERASWIKEGAISSVTGLIYGMSLVAASHPLDTIKTKMQAQTGFEKLSTYRTLIQTVKTDGFKGLYRGCIPPLWGSGIYRSLQFSGFETAYTYCTHHNIGMSAIPFTGGVEYRVIIGGISSATVRSIVETPLEYAKIKRQMGCNWKLKDCYTGMCITWARSCLLMPTFFISLDSFRRHSDDLFKTSFIGPFMTAGVSAIVGWFVCWPLEKMSSYQRLKFLVKERGGVIGLYRGLWPGLIRSFIGNGVGMIIMQYMNKKVTQLGLRN